MTAKVDIISGTLSFVLKIFNIFLFKQCISIFVVFDGAEIVNVVDSSHLGSFAKNKADAHASALLLLLWILPFLTFMYLSRCNLSDVKRRYFTITRVIIAVQLLTTDRFSM